MQINVDVQVPIIMLLNQGLLSGIYRGLKFGVRIQVEPIEVVVVGIESEVPTRYTVWVQQGHYFEDIVLKEQPTLLTVRKEKIDDAIQNKGGLHFARVDTG